MKDIEKKIEGSDPAGKSGEPTANAGESILSSRAVTDLLTSEFAAAEPEEPAEPGEEVQPGEDETIDKGEVTREEGAEKTEPEKEAEAEAELPAELATAIEQWEEAGKGELPKVLQSLVDRRIKKLADQRSEEKTGRETAESKLKEAVAETERLKTELATKEHKEHESVAASQPMGEAELGKLEVAARRFVEDGENFLDETATDDEAGRVQRFLDENKLDAKGLKRRLREINQWLTSALPETWRQAQAFQAQERALEPKAREVFPWLFDKATPEYGMAQDVLKVMPDLPQRTPGHRFALGIYVLGLKEFAKLHPEAAKAAGLGNPKLQAPSSREATNPKSQVKAPPKTPASGGAAASIRVNGKEAAEAAVRGRFEKAPTRENVTELLKQGLRS